MTGDVAILLSGPASNGRPEAANVEVEELENARGRGVVKMVRGEVLSGEESERGRCEGWSNGLCCCCKPCGNMGEASFVTPNCGCCGVCDAGMLAEADDEEASADAGAEGLGRDWSTLLFSVGQWHSSLLRLQPMQIGLSSLHFFLRRRQVKHPVRERMIGMGRIAFAYASASAATSAAT